MRGVTEESISSVDSTFSVMFRSKSSISMSLNCSVECEVSRLNSWKR